MWKQRRSSRPAIYLQDVADWSLRPSNACVCLKPLPATRKPDLARFEVRGLSRLASSTVANWHRFVWLRFRLDNLFRLRNHKRFVWKPNLLNLWRSHVWRSTVHSTRRTYDAMRWSVGLRLLWQFCVRRFDYQLYRLAKHVPFYAWFWHRRAYGLMHPLMVTGC